MKMCLFSFSFSVQAAVVEGGQVERIAGYTGSTGTLKRMTMTMVKAN